MPRMDALNLEAGNYRGTYKLVGGRPSLDLVNTVSWPGTARMHDWLDSPENLQRWMRAIGLPTPKAKASDLKAAIDLRNDLDAVLRPLASGEQPPRRRVEDLNRRIEQATLRRSIDPATLAWKWKPAEQGIDALAPVIIDAAELITAESHERLRHCPACAWLFEDRTRNGQRRWCDMADCGSRDKARRYYNKRSD